MMAAGEAAALLVESRASPPGRRTTGRARRRRSTRNGGDTQLSGRLRLHTPDVVEQHSLVPFRVNFFVHLADHTLRIDHEAAALPELHPFPLRLSNAERLHQAA